LDFDGFALHAHVRTIFTQHHSIVRITFALCSALRADALHSGSKCSGNSGNTGVSKHFYTRFTPAGYNPFTLIGLHLIAIPDDDARCLQREAQATVVKGIVAQQLVSARV
jgi:hypothetical protein